MTDHPENCGARCRLCPRTDLERLREDLSFSARMLEAPIVDVLAALPLLDTVVGVTAAGPVISNVVGTHATPVHRCGPLENSAATIGLRVDPTQLGAVVMTDPTDGAPPTLRFFDHDGQTVHAAYLMELSDRLAFESLALIGPHGSGMYVDNLPIGIDNPVDQLGMFDEILGDPGGRRLAALQSGARGDAVRIDTRDVATALTHAALIGMPVTLVTAATGCLHLRHDTLDGVRSHEGTLLMASSTARTMIDLRGISECWLTSAEGTYGPTTAMELYDDDQRCRFVATVTGAVDHEAWTAWQQLHGRIA